MKFLKDIKYIVKTKDNEEKITLKSIINNKSSGPYLIIFIINLLISSPIPILSTLLATINCFISYQMFLGKKNIKLPKIILNISISKNILKKIIEKISPIILKIEKITKNRFIILTNKKFIDLNIFISSLLAASPIPFLSIFVIISVCFLVFGYLNKDGLFILFGLIFAILNLILQILFIILGKILFLKIFYLLLS